MRWQYDRESRRYRNTESGRYIAKATVLKLRDDFLDHQASSVEDLAAKVAAGELSAREWLLQMRTLVKTTHAVEYTFGAGGLRSMTERDWTRVGDQVLAQFGYLQDFAQAIADGELSEAQIAARSLLYVNGAVASYERGRAAAIDQDLELPGMPGDGGTECLGNCRCSWDLVVTESEVKATWHTNADGRVCSGCQQRATDWSPWVYERPDAAAASA